jgi:hypothetical protein
MAEIPQSSFQGPLAPKFGLNDNFRNPIPSGQKNESGGKRNYGKLIPVGAVALALLILPLTISQINQQQDIRQQAEEPTPTIIEPIDGSPTPSQPLPPPVVFESTESAEIE